MAKVAPDLVVLALCLLAIALAQATKVIIQAAFAPLHGIGALGFYPFRNIADLVEGAIVGALDTLIKGSEKVAARAFSDLTQSLELLAALTILLGAGVYKALAYLWNKGIPNYVETSLFPWTVIVRKAESLVEAIPGKIVDAATAAYDRAAGYTDRKIADALAFVRPEIAAAKSAAEGYADLAVGRLRAAEDGAIAGAVSIATDAVLAGERAASAAETEAEQVAASALAQAQETGQAALAAVKSIAITAERDAIDIEQALGAAGVVGLVATIPAIATLVHAIATEAGLENADCRTKVKGICGTNTNAWTNLLEGAALIGLSFGLTELVAVAKTVIADGEDVIKQFA